MAYQYTIYTYGDGKVIAEMLNAVVAVVGDNAYTSLLHLSVLFGFIIAICMLIYKHNILVMVKWFATV